MSNNYFISAFGTFGNPNGFKQSYLFIDNSLANVARVIKTFDLNTNAVKLFPQSKVYAIRKEFAGRNNTIAYSIYTYAKEQNSDRSGTFIGSSILFVDKIAEENITINCLNEFHNDLKNKNVQNDVIIVTHSDKFSVSKPKDFDKINPHLKEIDDLNFVQTTNKNLVVFCRTNDNVLQSFFKKSVDLLNVYDTIYFTDSKEVAEFVRQKGIFTTVDENSFEKEIQKLAEERKRKNQEALDEFYREKQKLEEARKHTYENFKSQIEKNNEQHRQNEQKIRESEKDLNKINDFYNSFSRKIDELSNQLKSGSKKLDDVKQIYNANKRIFRESIGNLKTPNYTNTISQPRAITNIRETSQPLQTGHLYNDNDERHHRNRRNKEINIFKVATLILLLLWISTIVYFFIFKKPEKETVYEDKSQQEQILIEQPTNENIQELNPKPNAELNENDYKIVAKNIKYNTKIDEVIEIIFKHNPTDIKSSYDEQREIYSKQLIEANKNCFEDKTGVFYFVKDTLRHIPSYKK